MQNQTETPKAAKQGGAASGGDTNWDGVNRDGPEPSSVADAAAHMFANPDEDLSVVYDCKILKN